MKTKRTKRSNGHFVLFSLFSLSKWTGFLVWVIVEVTIIFSFEDGFNMKILFKTQVLSITFAIIWVVCLNILAFLDQPERALQYINWFVYGFAVLFAIISFLLTKYVIGHNWLAVPLVLVPYLIIYTPFFKGIMLSLVSKSYGMIINFLSISTGTIYLMAILISLVFGIIFSNRRNKA